MFELYLFLALVALGYIFGQWIEKKHYKDIIRREKETLSVPVVSLKSYPVMEQGATGHLVSGNVVISIDRFKQLLAGLRNFFGGRVTSYETLLDRARREAVLRMKERAISYGAKAVINIKIETASISKGRSNKGSVGSVEVVAYGTALVPNDFLK